MCPAFEEENLDDKDETFIIRDKLGIIKEMGKDYSSINKGMQSVQVGEFLYGVFGYLRELMGVENCLYLLKIWWTLLQIFESAYTPEFVKKQK